jgi:hypothetical protein
VIVLYENSYYVCRLSSQKEIFMAIEMNSFSSGLIYGTTLYRNQPGVSYKLIAQAGYALTAVVSAVETFVALAFSALSLIVYPISSTPFEHSTKWLGSSAFSLGWSVGDFVINLFMLKLVADEKSVRKMLQNGNLMMMPHGAHF